MRPAEESTRKVSVPGLKVAAFGPFGSFEVNPSLTLARRVFEDVEELEVAFAFVDAWLDRIRDEDWTALLVVGVDGKAEALRLETLGRNVVAALPDVRGEVRGPGKIDPLAPDTHLSTLWPASALGRPRGWTFGDDAGGYLCNTVLFKALQRFPDRRVGFLHVPTFSTVALDAQAAVLRRLARTLARESASS